MKFISSSVVVIFTLFLSCHPRSADLLQSEIDSVANRWVPDKRVGICNLVLVNGQGKEYILKGETLFPGSKTEVLQLLTNKGLTVVDSVIVLPDTTKLEKNWGLISLSVANLRSKPAHSAELASQAIMGTPVRILKENDEWFLVQTPENYIAWTNKSSVNQMNRSEFNGWKNSDRMMFTDTYGFISGDSKLTTVMSDLVAGAIVVKKSESQNIAEVSLPDGRTGFVSNLKWLNLKQWKDTVSLISDNLIVTGKRFLGFPYLWGGTSTKGMDCSGFSKTIYFLNGVILERDASQQFKHGKEIDISSGLDNLQKGDLLFFGSSESKRITHVGMYIGDSELIHSSGRVRINSLDPKRDNYSKHLRSTLLGARRIIGFQPEQGNLPIRSHNWY
ncbi:MAG: C40 family peptidase [Bacteroidia bacterium]|nr:C40 family peptidase [Bacteroidia bacterium]